MDFKLDIDAIRQLRDNLRKLGVWSETWQMSFNIDSCMVRQKGYRNLNAHYSLLGEELGSNTFVSPKTTDPYGGACVQGENYLIYGGEYGYLYNSACTLEGINFIPFSQKPKP